MGFWKGYGCAQMHEALRIFMKFAQSRQQIGTSLLQDSVRIQGTPKNHDDEQSWCEKRSTYLRSGWACLSMWGGRELEPVRCI